MVVTDRRLIFSQPGAPSLWQRLWQDLWWLPPFTYLALLVGLPWLSRPRSFELRHIRRFHTWAPPFSGPVMFEIGDEVWQFQLPRDKRSSRGVASRDAMREHYGVIERAWEAERRRPVDDA